MMACKRIINGLLLGLTGIALLCPSANAARLWADQPESANLRKVATLPDFVDLAAKLSPVVVNISTEQKETPTESPSPEGEADPFDRFGQPFEHYGLAHPHSLGSGFVINKEGYILTNDHVVEDAKQIVVTLKDGHEFKPRVIGRDNKSDIALIKIDRGWLGVYIQPVTAEIAQAAGLSAPEGAVIADVLENGPAKVAGLRRG